MFTKKMAVMFIMMVITIICSSCGEKKDTNIHRNNINIVSGTVIIRKESNTTTKSISTTSATTLTKSTSYTTTTIVTTGTINNSSTPTFWQDGCQYYSVQSNDSWFKIAEILGLDPIQLAYANGSTLDTVLQAGQNLFIPDEYTDYTIAQPTQQGSEQVIGSGCVSDFCDENSWTNIVQALNDINGLVLQPGEFMSWNERYGWKTAMDVDPNTGVNQYGYVEAPVIGDYNAPGGGICVVTTLFNITARNCNMGNILNVAHLVPVPYASGTDEAAVNYGSDDFSFYNSQPYAVIFYTSYEYPTIYMTCCVYQ